MKEAKEPASGAVKKDWEPRPTGCEVSGTARADRCHDGHHCRRHCLWKGWASITRSRALGSDRLAGSQRSAVGSSTDGRASTGGRCWRLSQAQPRPSEEKEGGGDPGKEQSQLSRETKHAEENCKRKEQQQLEQKRSDVVRDRAISQENSRWVWADSKMPRMCGCIERSFSKARSQ